MGGGFKSGSEIYLVVIKKPEAQGSFTPDLVAIPLILSLVDF